MTFCSYQCGGYYTVCPFREGRYGWGVECPYNIPHQDSEEDDKEEEK